MEIGVKRSASPLNNRNRTYKKRKTSNNGNNSNNNNGNNNTEFEVNLNENVATAIRAAIASIQSRRRRVHFPNNVNNTVKRRSHFNKTYLPNLVNEGATNEQISAAKATYQNFIKKAPYPPLLTGTAQYAAHKFAKFIESVNTITYVPEFAYRDLSHVFHLINGLPYKTATKKMMMRRAYKLLAFRKSENNNNTTKNKVLLLTPEQDAEIQAMMKIRAENWN